MDHVLCEFLDQCDRLGVALPESVPLAVVRARALEEALDRAVSPPVPELGEMDPARADEFAESFLSALSRRAQQHTVEVGRMRDSAGGHVIATIMAQPAAIVDALRPVHDALVEQITQSRDLLKGYDATTVLRAPDNVRAAWLAKTELRDRMKDVRRVRGQLTEWGHRLPWYNDNTRRDLEILTQFIDVPPTVAYDVIKRWFGYAREHAWELVLDESGQLWLPTIDQQRKRIEQLRAVKEAAVARPAIQLMNW